MDRSITSTFGANLTRIRIQRNLTRLELALLTGKSKRSIAQYEQGNRLPGAATVNAVAQALSIDSHELFRPIPEPIPTSVPESAPKPSAWDKFLKFFGIERVA